MRRMKDSGIEWIGEIPEEWETRRIKYIASLNGRIGWQGLTSKEYCDEGAFLITGINFVNGEIDWSSCVHVPMSRWEEAVEIQVQDGDLLITKDGTVGKVAIVDNMPGNTSLNSGVLLIRSDQTCETRFLYWMLQSDIFWKWFHTINSGNSTIIHLYQYDFCNFSFPFPDIWVQKSIADYLDRKCAQIDAVIARQEAVIEKLKEYKLSLITEAVTKGLNPDAPMKDSGVEWAGDIPMLWKTSKISRVSVTSSGATPLRGRQSEYFDDADIRWVRTLDLNDWFVFDSSEKITETALRESSCSVMPPNTVCVAMYGGGGTIGKCGILVNPSATNQAVCSIVCGKSVFPEYMLFQLLALKKYWMKFAVGTRKDPNISQDTVGRMRVLVPPYKEQEAIAVYLKDKCQDLDDVVKKKQDLIDRLTSYKKSLIYEVVTGKREVPA